MQLDFAFLKFTKNHKNCSPTVLHLTYVFWQTWHLMDQTWYFCIGTMAWQFWYPENFGLLVVPVPPRRGSFPWDESSPRATLFFPRVPPPFFARHLLSSCNRRLLFLQRREARRSITASSPCRSCTTTPSSCWGSPPWGRRRSPRAAAVSSWSRRSIAAKERATGEGIAREKESARATREKIFREDERFPDRNAKSKMSNTWRLTYFFFGKKFRDLTNSNK